MLAVYLGKIREGERFLASIIIRKGERKRIDGAFPLKSEPFKRKRVVIGEKISSFSDNEYRGFERLPCIISRGLFPDLHGGRLLRGFKNIGNLESE